MPLKYSMKTTRNGSVLAAQIKRGCQANLKAAAMIWHGGVLQQLRGTRTGRTYFVPGTGGTHMKPITVRTKHPRYKVSSYVRDQKKRYGVQYRASAPGEAPAVRLGDLRTSYRYTVSGDFMAEVGSPLMYAFWLEKGTENMAPRPHLMPAYLDKREQILAALERDVI